MKFAPAWLRRVLCVSLFGWCAAVAAAADPGTLTGTVSNTATGNLLEGAKVEIPSLGRSTLVDHTGSYLLTDVPAGTHELVVSYIGLDTVRRTVSVAASRGPAKSSAYVAAKACGQSARVSASAAEWVRSEP
jgi:hypothetical protein